MKINYNVTGSERKALVTAISQELNAPAKYLGAPTFAYEVGGYHIDKNGMLTGGYNSTLVENLKQFHGFTAVSEDYYEEGMQASGVPESYTYQAELSDPDCPDRMEVFSANNDEDALRRAYEYCGGEVVLLELFELDGDYGVIRSVGIPPRTDRLTIEYPLDGFTPEKLSNLFNMVNAKAPLLKAALGADELPIKQTTDTLLFPWFSGGIDAEHTKVYSTFVSLLCKTAKEKKRVTAKEKDSGDNPKYAMRCFLLSLGMIGGEYKAARKILLSKLEGNSSWGSNDAYTAMQEQRRKPINNSEGMNSTEEMLADAELIHAVNASFENV